MVIAVRTTRSSDVEGLVRVAAAAYADAPDMKLWEPYHLRAHLDVFPEGQFVAVHGGRPVGFVSTLRARSEAALLPHTWTELTGGTCFPNHDPAGDVLYGAEVCVDPAYRRRGVAKKLYAARKDLARRRNLKGIVAGGRIPGFARHAGTMTPDAYVHAVEQGALKDPVLSFQVRSGFRVRGVLPRYIGDSSSEGFASLIFWPNPVHAPEAVAGAPVAPPRPSPAASRELVA